MEPKKISFGFSKINKKLTLATNKECFNNESKVELIKCLEGHEIKLVEEKPEEQPLTIPLKESQKTSAALASLIKRRAVLLGEEEQDNATENNKSKEDRSSNTNNDIEDIEKRAARELIAELHANGSSDPSSNLVLPVVKPDDLPLDGAKESSLDDYESIPIQDFGKAMLRGMGWSEPSKVDTKGGPHFAETPLVRPKGMGLGADKALKKQPLLVAPESNEVLEIKRNAYVRILGGKHKDLYGQIEGFDDHAGRVIVKMAIGGTKETFNEFLCQPISRKEFGQYGKCINSTKYEEYKKKENEFGQIILKKEEFIEADIITKNHTKIKKEKRDSRDRINSDESDRKMDYKDERKEFKRGREDERDRKQKVQSDNRNEFKIEKDRDEKWNRRRENYGEGERDANRDDVHDRRRDKGRDDHNNHGRNLNRDDDKIQRRDADRYDARDRNPERDRHASKYDERNQQAQSYNDNRDRVRERESYRDRERNYYRDYCEKDFNRDNRDRHSYKNSRDDERSQDKDIHAERSTTHNPEVVQIFDSSDSENDSHSSKHKKSSRRDKNTKKTKKFKKSKSKNDISECETSSSSSSEEERRKKHKKKTKKSKKQRERSRSR